ncbi:hypothetical protein JMUB7490_25320 [Staphylococcus aureus]|uniref:Uncharacterized protein n=1 Tax=Staphylococcus aureus TaxID=1280 RepID=A0A811APX6_STAAU|nr:hypothetical protein [Staphylococcus aureus]BDX51518.1 hypothetical protein [Staphylococcus aureus]GFD66658.1 hypothetical protein ksw1_26350 [Staphylococcus aureus]
MNSNLFLQRNKIRIRGNKIRNNYKYNNTKIINRIILKLILNNQK